MPAPETTQADTPPAIEIPEPLFLAYVVNREAWYYPANQKIGSLEGRSLNVSAANPAGGCRWEFTVQEYDINGGAVRLQMFDDSFQAFEQIPGFFQALTSEQPSSLDQVREILDRLGAVDTTERVSPYRHDPRAELVRKVEEAQAELARFDIEHADELDGSR